MIILHVIGASFAENRRKPTKLHLQAKNVLETCVCSTVHYFVIKNVEVNQTEKMKIKLKENVIFLSTNQDLLKKLIE